MIDTRSHSAAPDEGLAREDLRRVVLSALRRWADTRYKQVSVLLALARLSGTRELPRLLAAARSEGLVDADRSCHPTQVSQDTQSALEAIQDAAEEYRRQ